MSYGATVSNESHTFNSLALRFNPFYDSSTNIFFSSLSLSLVSEVKVFCSLLSKFWKWNFESFLRTNKIWIIYVYIFIVHLFILLCRVIRATSPEDPEVVQLVEREYRAVTNSNI